MASDSSTYTIGELAAEFDVSTRTIRFYEDRGLLQPSRRGTTRIYTPRDRTRLKLVLRGKRLGFSLDEIREIVDLYDAAPGERGQLVRLLERIAQHRREVWERKKAAGRTLAELDQMEQRARDRLAQLEDGTQRP